MMFAFLDGPLSQYEELFEYVYSTFSEPFRALVKEAFVIRREMKSRDRLDETSVSSPGSIQNLERGISECANHTLYRCCYCLVGGTMSECVKQHLYAGRSGGWQPDSYINTDGIKMAHCGLFYNNVQADVLFRFVNTSRVIYEGQMLGVPKRMKDGDMLCIYCIEKILLQDDGYLPLNTTVRRDSNWITLSFNRWRTEESGSEEAAKSLSFHPEEVFSPY
ncbi:TPA_asm: protein 4 [Pinus flexilis virus 1]|uniref:Protein 4 n=1 Tax=Pinus flexilis virus 1 TaxID=2793737 RepID=A0A8D9PH06_9RHAB|nr:protein 4 [Pinus flexilis virus 1]DAF42372.1 TPA_asm: protein 4 [Pinus flexilis virus 1]